MKQIGPNILKKVILRLKYTKSDSQMNLWKRCDEQANLLEHNE